MSKLMSITITSLMCRTVARQTIVVVAGMCVRTHVCTSVPLALAMYKSIEMKDTEKLRIFAVLTQLIIEITQI